MKNERSERKLLKIYKITRKEFNTTKKEFPNLRFIECCMRTAVIKYKTFDKRIPKDTPNRNLYKACQALGKSLLKEKKDHMVFVPATHNVSASYIITIKGNTLRETMHKKHKILNYLKRNEVKNFEIFEIDKNGIKERVDAKNCLSI